MNIIGTKSNRLKKASRDLLTGKPSTRLAWSHTCPREGHPGRLEAFYSHLSASTTHAATWDQFLDRKKSRIRRGKEPTQAQHHFGPSGSVSLKVFDLFVYFILFYFIFYSWSSIMEKRLPRPLKVSSHSFFITSFRLIPFSFHCPFLPFSSSPLLQTSLITIFIVLFKLRLHFPSV